MPRARCHWALLAETRAALRTRVPAACRLVDEHRAEYFAGGMAPDAMRLFAGKDKASTHFYDDQQQETWGRVLESIVAAYPAVAASPALAPAGQAWMVGYLTHILTDVAYWRHIISCLPPFPEHTAVHHGAWVLADGIALPPDERAIDLSAIQFGSAPPWVQEAPVRAWMERITGRILAAEGRWPVEAAYFSGRPEARGRTVEEILRERLPEWRRNVEQAAGCVSAAALEAFRADAVSGSVAVVEAYLSGSPEREP